MVKERLIPALSGKNMMLSQQAYKRNGVPDNFQLASIPDFNSLIAKSQDFQTPVFALSDQQLGQVGTVLTTTRESREDFRGIFLGLTDKVIGLTADASDA